MWFGKNDDDEHLDLKKRVVDPPTEPVPELVAALAGESLGPFGICEHPRTLSLGTKCSDQAWMKWPSGQLTEGYAPDIPGLCGGDYIEVTVCLDCKVVIGLPDAEDILATILVEDVQPPPRSRWEDRTVHTGEDDGNCDVCGYPREQALCEACGIVEPSIKGGQVWLGEVGVSPYAPPPTRKKDH